MTSLNHFPRKKQNRNLGAGEELAKTKRDIFMHPYQAIGALRAKHFPPGSLVLSARIAKGQTLCGEFAGRLGMADEAGSRRIDREDTGPAEMAEAGPRLIALFWLSPSIPAIRNRTLLITVPLLGICFLWGDC